MYSDTLTQFGLAKNEARIYETLLREGECSVGQIATKSGVNRRNVYDSLNRLLEKGLVFEVLMKHESRYQAVDPKKLKEVLSEKQILLDQIMPNLETMFRSTPHPDSVFIYRGLEGWKNYMREIIRVGQDDYIIGGKGAWANPSLRPFFDQFLAETKKRGINFHILFNEEIRKSHAEFIDCFGAADKNYRFLPKGYLTNVSLEIFGDHLVILQGIEIGRFDEMASLTIIVNQGIADSFRTWFTFMWDCCASKNQA